MGYLFYSDSYKILSALHKESFLLCWHPRSSFFLQFIFLHIRWLWIKKTCIIRRTSTQPSCLLIRDVHQVQVCFSSIMGRNVLTHFELFDCWIQGVCLIQVSPYNEEHELIRLSLRKGGTRNKAQTRSYTQLELVAVVFIPNTFECFL